MTRAVAVVALAALPACRAAPPPGGASAAVGDVRVERAVAWTAPDGRSATVGFHLTSASADTLLGADAGAALATLHDAAASGGMRPAGRVPLRPLDTLRAGRGLHLMVEGLASPLARGDTLRLRLFFARADTLPLAVPVLRYSDALEILGE